MTVEEDFQDDSSDKKISDEALISLWRAKRDQTAYKTLQSRHKRMVFKYVQKYSAAAIPNAALEAKAWELFDDAINGFSPTSGAKFSTFLDYQVRKLDRYAKRYQNIARIPEALSAKIGDYDRANEQLTQELGRIPTPQEISKKMKLPVGHVKQIIQSRRGDLYEGRFEQGDIEAETERADWLLIELREELNPQEQEVYDYLIGYNQTKLTSKKALAKKLKMSPGRVSQITRQIALKIGPGLRKKL